MMLLDYLPLFDGAKKATVGSSGYYEAAPVRSGSPAATFTLQSSIEGVREAYGSPAAVLSMTSSVSGHADMSEARRRDEQILLAF